MILVINLNASLDKKYDLTNLEKGTVMRARSVQNTPGGKGLHVAHVAAIMGADCIATGFLAGHNGDFIAEQVAQYGIRQDFIRVDTGETRCCLAFITADHAQTEVLEPGPDIPHVCIEAFLKKYDAYLDTVDMAAASGSLPGNVPDDFYSTLIVMAKRKHVKFFLDTSGTALRHGINATPYFIKPNEKEITAYTGRPVAGIEELAREIQGFLDNGIGVAAVSLGKRGALAGYQNRIYRITVPEIQAVNPVGSGDSFVGGFLAAAAQGCDTITALKMAAACGTANTMEKETAVVKKSAAVELMQQITVKELTHTEKKGSIYHD